MKKIAIITGASGGLGKEFVRQIINEVDEVWAIGRKLEKLEALQNELAQAGNKIIPLQIDLSDTKNLSKLTEKLQANQDDFKILWLINNAGAGRFAPSTDFSTEELEANISTHCTAMAAICNICIPYMKENSHIVNVASQSAFSPLTYMNLYAATKAFVYSYSRALEIELRKTGIKVTTVCPGWIKTALLPESLNGHKVKYPFIAHADKVAEKAIKAARKGKSLSIYKFSVRYVCWLQRHWFTKSTLRLWTRMVEKYI